MSSIHYYKWNNLNYIAKILFNVIVFCNFLVNGKFDIATSNIKNTHIYSFVSLPFTLVNIWCHVTQILKHVKIMILNKNTLVPNSIAPFNIKQHLSGIPLFEWSLHTCTFFDGIKWNKYKWRDILIVTFFYFYLRG